MGASAATMFLRKTEGTVAVADGEGADIAPAENLGLYSGYTVGTRAESFAWIDLDNVKLAKLDENGEIHIVKDGKNLSIDVNAGSLFFNITEPLAEDETMEIRASSMLVGIRGTCGWVEAPEDGAMRVYILEGRVECAAGENTAAVNAGEMAEITADGTITVEPFSAAKVPAFVASELMADEALNVAVREASGFDVAEDPRRAYADIFAELEQNEAVVLLAEEFDFEADGSPELLVIADSTAEDRVIGKIYQDTAEGMVCVGSLPPILHGELSSGAGYTLAQSGGKLFVKCLTFDTYEGTSGETIYRSENGFYGFGIPEGGGPREWGCLDGAAQASNGVLFARSGEEGHLKHGQHGAPSTYPDMKAEYDAILARYTDVRGLLAYDGTKASLAS